MKIYGVAISLSPGLSLEECQKIGRTGVFTLRKSDGVLEASGPLRFLPVIGSGFLRFHLPLEATVWGMPSGVDTVAADFGDGVTGVWKLGNENPWGWTTEAVAP